MSKTVASYFGGICKQKGESLIACWKSLREHSDMNDTVTVVTAFWSYLPAVQNIRNEPGIRILANHEFKKPEDFIFWCFFSDSK